MPNLSAWTATGSSINLVAATTPVSTASSPVDVNYLTNSDKIALMNQYATELASKTTLDTTAAGLSVSHVSYDNAVAAINTLLLGAGAPSNWATTWPDGTTLGPVVGIQSLLASAWATVATNRVALQGSISAAQAAAAQIAATAASQLHVVSWASTSKPTLPSGTYPAGYLAQTTDNLTFQVNAAGTAWVAILYSAAGVFGQIQAGQIAAGAVTASMISAGVLTAGYIYFSDGFCLNTLEPKESGADVTLAHVNTAVAASGTPFTFTLAQLTTTGVAFSVVSKGTSDVFNLTAAMLYNVAAGTYGAFLVALVDGAIGSQFGFGIDNIFYGSGPSVCNYTGSVTGLSAGAHTITLYFASMVLTYGNPFVQSAGGVTNRYARGQIQAITS